MPLYQYECRGCGTRFTETMSVEDLDKRKLQCPKCRSQNTEQVIEAPHVVATKKS
jgi:putative FmdB family regulatory protein